MPFAISDLLDVHFYPEMKRATRCAHLEAQHSPLSFYDRHVHPDLLLRHIVSAPSLANDLIEFCDENFSKHSPTSFSDEEISGYRPSSKHEFTDGPNLFHYYNAMIGTFAGLLASRFYVFPKPTRWKNAILLTRETSYRYLFHFEGYTEIAHGVEITRDAIYDEDYKAATERYKGLKLAWYLFLPSSDRTDKLLRSLKAASHFRWDMPATSEESKVVACPKPADATSGFVKGWLDLNSTPTRTLPARTAKSKPLNPKKPVVKPPHSPKQVMDHRYNPHHYLQSMWVRACENDNTFMILNCGDVERIGIRHRESQTLFLSGPINPKAPGYAKIHVGLYCAVMTDVMSRFPADSATTPSNGSGKRAAEEAIDTEPARKRPRTRMSGQSNASKRPDAKMYAHLNKLDMLVVRLNYGVHKSAAPSCFLRVGSSCVPGLHNPKFIKPTRQKEYDASEYIDLELGERLGQGSCGSGHKGTAEVVLASGDIQRCPLAIKLSFTEDEKEKLRHEFSVYEFLARKKYTHCILPVHGLFEDLETGHLALLMNYGGISLQDRDRAMAQVGRRDYERVTMSGPERTVLKKFVKDIHRMRMIHGDLKPSNTLVNEDGELFVIDFDTAKPDSSPNSVWFIWDWAACNGMLKGTFSHGFYYGHAG